MKKKLNVSMVVVGLRLLVIVGLFLGAGFADELSILRLDPVWIRAGFFGFGVVEIIRFFERYGFIEIGRDDLCSSTSELSFRTRLLKQVIPRLIVAAVCFAVGVFAEDCRVLFGICFMGFYMLTLDAVCIFAGAKSGHFFGD